MLMFALYLVVNERKLLKANLDEIFGMLFGEGARREAEGEGDGEREGDGTGGGALFLVLPAGWSVERRPG